MGLLIAIVLAALPAPVTPNGVGGGTPGMTPAQVARAWGTKVVLDHALPGSSCQTAEIVRGRVRGYALFEGKRLGAVFFSAGVKTDTGIGIGSPFSAVRSAYGSKLVVQADRYTPKAKNAYVGGKWKVRFDVSPKGKVTAIAFGGRPVTYSEGCA